MQDKDREEQKPSALKEASRGTGLVLFAAAVVLAIAALLYFGLGS